MSDQQVDELLKPFLIDHERRFAGLHDHVGRMVAYVQSEEVRSLLSRLLTAREEEKQASHDILQAVLDAVKGTLDTSTNIADHPNVKFVQMERLKWTARSVPSEPEPLMQQCDFCGEIKPVFGHFEASGRNYCADCAPSEPVDIRVRSPKDLAATIVRLNSEVEALRAWRADVTVALHRDGGAFFDDVPRHIRDLRQEREELAEAIVGMTYRSIEDHEAWTQELLVKEAQRQRSEVDAAVGLQEKVANLRQQGHETTAQLKTLIEEWRNLNTQMDGVTIGRWFQAQRCADELQALLASPTI